MKKTNLGSSEVFARNLERYINAAGVKKIDVARAIGLSPSSISDWIIGRTYPKMDHIQLLAEYFGVQKSDLVDDVCVTKDFVTEQDQEIIDLFHKVPEEKREFVLSMIRAAINNL
jgi:transcriptional regulator with XRE-family HTH domain